ncbi:MAG: DsbC family protein [Pseudohongiellaceae bacterium]
MKAMLRWFAGVSALGLSAAVFAQSSAVVNPEYEALRDTLDSSLGGATRGQLSVQRIRPSAMDGMLEVTLNSGEVLFTDPDGEFMLTGDLLRTNAQGFVNLSAETRKEQNIARVAAVPDEEVITFSPDGDVRATISVFTDVDCTFCRRLHGDMDEILGHGIEVRYLAYPRGGTSAASYGKMLSVWCSDDRKRALTQAKNDQNLPERNCDNPVLKHYELGNQVGISGTPAIILQDGTVVPGYAGLDRLTSLVFGQ